MYSVDFDSGKVIGEPLSISSNPIPLISTDNNPNWSVSGVSK